MSLIIFGTRNLDNAAVKAVHLQNPDVEPHKLIKYEIELQDKKFINQEEEIIEETEQKIMELWLVNNDFEYLVLKYTDVLVFNNLVDMYVRKEIEYKGIIPDEENDNFWIAMESVLIRCRLMINLKMDLPKLARRAYFLSQKDVFEKDVDDWENNDEDGVGSKRKRKENSKKNK